MKTYRVKTNCYGFKGKYWEESTIVQLEDDEEPPIHFELMGVLQAPETNQNDTTLDPQKPLPFELGKPVRPKGGFGSSINPNPPEIPMTAGKALKNNKK